MDDAERADQEDPTSQPPARAPATRRRGGRWQVAGWLFMAPALVLLLVQQVAPAVRTVIWSFQDEPGGTWVSVANYQTAVQWGLPGDLVSGVGFGLLPAVLGFIAGFGGGRVFAGAQGMARRAGLVLLALALLWMAPTSLVLGTAIWMGLGQPALVIGLLTWLPVALVIGALVGAMLPAGVRIWLALTLGVLIAAVAGAALGVQASALALTGSAPSPPAGRLYMMAFATLDLGPAFAIGAVLLVLAMVAGVVVTRALLASGLRFWIRPRSASAGGSPGDPAAAAPGGAAPVPAGRGGPGDVPAGAGATAVTVGAVVLLVSVLVSLPWLVEALRAESTVDVPGIHSWLGDGLEVLVAVVVAALAGTGIGYLRPLGDRSLHILLSALSPLLFVGVAPLLVAHFVTRLDRIAEPGPWGSLHPQVVVVPLVFLAAYLADAWHVARPERGRLAPGRLMFAALGVAGVALLILRLESTALRMMPGRERAEVGGAIQRLDVASAVAQLKPWPVLLLLAVVVALCAAGMRRLRIDVGAPVGRRR